MQTPPAINISILLIPVLFGKSMNSSDKVVIEDEINLTKERPLPVSENNFIIDKEITDGSPKGFITVNNKKQEVTKLELLNLIDLTKKNIVDKPSAWRTVYAKQMFLNEFRELVNGVFQAEGHIGGYFPSASTITFRPLVFISQNASDSSIEFLSLLWLILDKNFKFAIYQNESSKYFHIRIYTRDWDFIIKKLIPYFSLVYGDKFKGFIRLKKIFDLLIRPRLTEGEGQKKSNLLSPPSKVRIINLAYNLVDNPRKKTLISDKIFSVLGETNCSEYSDNIETYPDNRKSLSILFIFGFLLGDGNFSIRIRDTKTGVWFIPIIRLEQKDTLDNSNLLNNIEKYLNKLNIKGRIHRYAKTHNSSHIVFTIDNKTSVHNFFNIIKKHRELFFWKKEQLELILKSFIIMSVAARHWKESQIALLRVLYNNNSNREFSFNYWEKRLVELYVERKKASTSNEFYITMSKNVAWAVNLPVALKMKPKTKYFFFKTYNNSKEKAFNAAIEYRNTHLNNWLIDKGLK